MRSMTVTSQCPHWCVREHPAAMRGADFYHASDTSSVTASMTGGPGAPEWVDVQRAQYVPDDPGEPAWTATVEIALHTGDRYRLIGLTLAEARQLAAILSRAADLPG
jgi:hypothetical protein